MNPLFRFLVVINLCAGPPTSVAQADTSTDAQRPELAYLKQVNQWRPPSDPQLLFLLMAQFANAGRHAEGIDYFNGVLMVADGKHELAAAVLRWAQPRFANSVRLEAVRKLTYLRLMEKYQELNPFKFILYSGEIGQSIAQMDAKPAEVNAQLLKRARSPLD